jgi:glycosyltransferase involved in cell wall biosynthesis
VRHFVPSLRRTRSHVDPDDSGIVELRYFSELPEDPLNSSVVLSVFPLPVDARLSFALPGQPEPQFCDIAALRRGGLADTWRHLRSLRVRRTIVAGTAAEISDFGDLLRLIALLVPCRERVVQVIGGAAEPFGRGMLPVLASRLAIGTTAGFAALSSSAVRVRAYCRSAPRHRTETLKTDRCLYLKPTLQFGPAVGGAVAHTTGIVNALHRSGQQVRVLALNRHPGISSSVTQIEVPAPPSRSYPHELNWHVYQRRYGREALRQAAAFKPDYVYQRYSINDFTGLEVTRRLNVPLVLEFNGSEVWAQRHWGRALRFEAVAERIELANLKGADLVTTVSEEIRRQVCALGITEERVLFYPNCVDPTVFDPARFGPEDIRKTRAKLGVPPDSTLLTFVGSFGRWHGTDALAEAIRRLIDSDREFLDRNRLHFLFVGDGACAPKVRSILGPQLGGPYVTLAGFRPQEEGPAILAASNIHLSPHIPNPDGTPFFGSPTKLFEYMAMERPIVASDLDQIGSVLKGWRPGRDSDARGPAAILTVPGSVDSLIEGIRSAVGLPDEERRRLGTLARTYVLESFTWDRNVAVFLDRLRQLRST